MVWSRWMLCALALTMLSVTIGCSDETQQFSEGDNAELVIQPSNISFNPLPVGEQSQQVVQVANTGTDTLFLPASGSNYELDPATAPFWFSEYVTVDGKTVTEIAPNSTADLVITYIPEDENPASATLKLISSNGGEATLTITTSRPVPVLQVNPNPVVFGDVADGSSAEMDVVVSNVGTADLVIEDVLYQATNTTDFEMIEGINTSAGSVTLRMDETRTLKMRYTPTGDPTVQDIGELIFYTNTTGASNGQTVVEVKAPGNAPRIEVIPGRVDFGAQDPGSLTSAQIIVSNVGDDVLNIREISFSLDTSADFAYLGEGGAPVGSADSGFDLAPAESKTLEVTYAPSDAGLDTGYLYFYSNDPINSATNVVLSGSQAGPKIIVQPQALEFGQVAATITKSLSFSIINDGTRDLEVTDLIAVDFPTALTYEVDGGLGDTFTLPAGDQTSVTVTFAPAVVLPFSNATLEVHSNDADNAQIDVLISYEGVETGDCVILLEPSKLNFGLVPGGQTKTSPLTVRNTGAVPCNINGLDVRTSTLLFGSNPFELATPFTAQLLQPSDTMLIDFDFAPFSGSDTEDFAGQAVFTITDALSGAPVECPSPVPSNPAGLIAEMISGGGQGSCFMTFFSFDPLDILNGGGNLDLPGCWACLVGKTGDPALAAVPSVVDFGLTTLGCNSQTIDLNVYNRGSAFTDISSIYLDPTCTDASGGPFFLYGVPTLPRQLNAGEVIPLQLVYTPTGLESNSCRLFVEGATETLTIPLNGEGTTETQAHDVFEQISGRKVDVLFVIDNSGSMGDDQTNLANNFSSFIQTAQTWSVDFQIGVTTTDASDEGRLLGSPRILTPTTPNLAGAFGNNAQPGSNGSSTERGLVAAYNALSDPNITENVPGACPGGCAAPYTCDNPSGACGGSNASFLREDASLEIVMVSDEDDFSPAAVSFYADFFKNIKGYRNDSLMHVHSIVGDCSGNTSNRYTDVSALTGGVVGSLCNNFATTLSNIGNNAFGLRVEFFLSRVPEEATIVVTVDGVEMQRGTDWVYYADSNSVGFTSAPAENSIIEVDYRAKCF